MTTASATTEKPAERIVVESETLGRNLAVLGSRNPRAAKAIALAEHREGLEWFENESGQVSATLDGRSLASRRRPIDEARRLADGVDLETHACAVILGFGIGHHVVALAERAKKELVVVVYEPDVSLLRSVLEKIDMSEAFAQGMVVLLTDEADGASMTSALRGSEPFVSLGTEYVHHPPSVERLGASAKRFCETFAKYVSTTRTLIATTLMQSDVTARNQLMNADRYALNAGIDDLRDSAKGRLGVVVSAGPSLKRNLHLLAEPGVRERCAIVAVQTVLRPMLDAGIKPHFITALDYHEVSKRFYEGLTAEDVEGITLIVEPKANAAILGAWPGAVRTVGDPFLDKVLGEKIVSPRERLKAGATVAHLAYYVARFLGCDPVALIGQDLAFTDGQYYAKGAAIHDSWACELNPFNTLEMMEWQRIVRFRGNLYRVEDHLGRTIFTDDQMSTYLSQFERDFLEDTEAGLTVIDATEGGVKKAHADVRTLAETLDEHAPPGAEPITLPAPSATERERTLPKVRDRLRKLSRDSARISSLSREALAHLEHMATLDPSKLAAINTEVEKVHAIRDRVEGITTAWNAVQHLSQTAMFKRFKADRLLRLAEGIDEMDAHAHRVDRDIVNVRWLAEVGEYISMLLATAAEASNGGERLTRDLPIDENAGVVRTQQGTLPAVVVARFNSHPMGTAPATSGDLARTLTRLNSCERIDRAAILTDDPSAARDAIESAGLPLQTIVLDAEPLDLSRGVRSSRLLAPTCWRGGLGRVSCYDEIIDPRAALRALDELQSEAAIFVGGDWTELDAAICDGVVIRHHENTEQHSFVFTQASVGLAGIALSRQALSGMIDARRSNAPGVLTGDPVGYNTLRPMLDPINKSWCVSVDLDRRSGARRYDSAVATPLHLTLELTTDRRACHPTGRTTPRRATMDAARAHAIIEQIDPTVQPTALTIAGFGDPLTHPHAIELIRAAKGRGIGAVHIRTDLIDQDEPALDALLESGVDAISVDLSTIDAPTYAALRGIDAYERAQLNLERLMHARTHTDGIPDVWLVPRLTRRDEVYTQIEQFYDAWLLTGAAPVLDPLHAPIDGARIDPLGKPRSAELRERETEMLVLADGTVPINAHDESGASAGNLINDSLDAVRDSLIDARAKLDWTGPDDLVAG